MVMANLSGQMAVLIVEIIIKDFVKGLDNTLIVRTQVFQRGYGRKESSMEKDNIFNLEEKFLNVCGPMARSQH